jgi:ATP-dependent RNA circularization protein (DNA/RNA ligase family)
MLDVNVLNDKEFQKQFENYDCVVKDIKKDNYKQLLLMKDVISLTEKYQIKYIQPIDMFPFTAHVESVVLLELKK